MKTPDSKSMGFIFIALFLIVPHVVSAQTCDGVITNSIAYGCENEISLGLADSDLTDPDEQPQIIATVGSDTETINLNGNPPGSGFFSGFILTDDSPPSPENGRLNVAHGQIITFTYHDESYCGPPQVVTTIALVDCVAPVITNVLPINITSSSVVITWDTNELADSSVTLIPGGTITFDNRYVLEHWMPFHELSRCTQYLFLVESVDIAVNTTTDDNGGAFYTFTTACTCTFCDEFSDGILDPNWTYVKNVASWSESADAVSGTSAKSTQALAIPAFGGCTTCYAETVMRTAGGTFSKIFFLFHVEDKFNLVELQMNDSKDRWVAKHRINKAVVSKQQFLSQIDPNTDYTVRIRYDGTNFIVSIDGVDQITLAPGGTVTGGSVGFKVKKAIGNFERIEVN